MNPLRRNFIAGAYLSTAVVLDQAPGWFADEHRRSALGAGFKALWQHRAAAVEVTPIG